MAEYTIELSPEEEGLRPRVALRKQRWIIAAIIPAIVLVLAGMICAVIAFQTNQPAATNIRDIFIIFMAFESLIIGAALVVLVIQIASLINLLQNEVRPDSKSTSDRSTCCVGPRNS